MSLQLELAHAQMKYSYSPVQNFNKTVPNPKIPAACIFGTLYDNNDNFSTRIYVFSSELTKSCFLMLPN